MANEIDPEHVLPCDFIVGHVRFAKGVTLETVRQAAERWHRAAAENYSTKVSATTLGLVGPPR